MQKIILSLAFVALCLSACQQDKSSVQSAPTSTATNPNGLSINLANDPALQHGNLRIYPIVGDADLIREHASLANVKTLEEGMKTPGFRITELKQFGRQRETWYNGLTVANKTADTIYMMSGDVVVGGNQDRVNGEDLMALPGTIRNINVFCVEHGRSSYYKPDAPAEEKKMAAFYGFYNVASPSVRKAVYNNNQSEVWNQVSVVTDANSATTSTSTYTGLEADNEHKARRQEYVDFFSGKFEAMENTVGLVAVCNGEIIGVEIFGHPNLFKRRAKALMHSYAVEAAVKPQTSTSVASEADVKARYEAIARLARPTAQPSPQTGRFSVGSQWVHLYVK